MFDKSTITEAKASSLRDKAMTMYAAAQQMAYEYYIGVLGDHDEFIVKVNWISNGIRNGQYTGADGSQRHSYKPFSDQIDFFNNECKLNTWEWSEIIAHAERYYERQLGNPPVGSGSFAERQSFQTDDRQANRPEYANADLYKANQIEERIKEVETKIERLNSKPRLNQFEMKNLDRLNKQLVDLYDNLREVS